MFLHRHGVCADPVDCLCKHPAAKPAEEKPTPASTFTCASIAAIGLVGVLGLLWLPWRIAATLLIACGLGWVLAIGVVAAWKAAK